MYLLLDFYKEVYVTVFLIDVFHVFHFLMICYMFFFYAVTHFPSKLGGDDGSVHLSWRTQMASTDGAGDVVAPWTLSLAALLLGRDLVESVSTE